LSPILVRPVREQLEHDRIIRLLHGKFRRKYEAGMNPGIEQNMPVGSGPTALYPDLVLLAQDRGHKLQIIVEIETGESVNHLEALAQWAHYGRVRAAFHLYVPANMVDVARRLTDDNQIHVAELWSYHVVGEEPRFTLVHRNREAISALAKARPVAKVTVSGGPSSPVPRERAAKPASKPAPKAAAKPAKAAMARPVRAAQKAKARPPARPKAKASKPKKTAVKKKK
jgi:hypothetical protein